MKRFLFVIILIFISNPCFALVKIDNESVDLAIKYGIKSKGLLKEDLLGANLINDNSERILSIYSPFIQIAVKSSAQNTSDNLDNDVKNARECLKTTISRIKEKNEIRFIVEMYGDKEDFAQNYTALISRDESLSKKNNKIYKPRKSSTQKIASRDGFNPLHPYSAFNCYIFSFEDLFSLKDYYLFLVSKSVETYKFRINNDNIF